MGLALAASDARAKRLLDLASDATKVDLLRAIERGGRALTRTEVLQPALVAVSLGAAHALESRGVSIAAALGHSLGELAAACFVLGVDDETAIALAAERGRRMAAAAEARPGGMVAVASIDASASDLVLAAHNADDEHVLSGDEVALAHFVRQHRATRLRVAGAWHSPAMSSVVEPFRQQLDRAFVDRTLRMAFVSAVTASVVPLEQASDVLSRGLVSPVRWFDTLRALAPLGISGLALAPPGRLSRALVRRNLRSTLDVRMMETPSDLEAI